MVLFLNWWFMIVAVEQVDVIGRLLFKYSTSRCFLAHWICWWLFLINFNHFLDIYFGLLNYLFLSCTVYIAEGSSWNFLGFVFLECKCLFFQDFIILFLMGLTQNVNLFHYLILRFFNCLFFWFLINFDL